MMKPFKRIDQICIVVRDLQKTIEHYWVDFGVGPWKIYEFEEPLLRETTIKGKAANYRMRLALCQMDNIFLELIQPLSGQTIYKEFLEEKGEGLHHFGFFVDDLDQGVRNFELNGIGTIQTGRFQKGGFAYLDTQEKFGTVFELIERSKPPHPPIRIWPEEDK
jgi:catechol 2,3-dioxygenase-like lactoylglutathione lyase family enzyme